MEAMEDFQMTRAEQLAHLKRLKKINPQALLFTVIDLSDDGSDTESAASDTDTAEEDIELPPTVPELINTLNDGTMSAETVLQKVLGYKATAGECPVVQVSNNTKPQSALLLAHRVGRITDSFAHSILSYDGSEVPQATVNTVITGSCGFTDEAMAWRLEHEKDAIASLTEILNSKHQDTEITPAGLFICPDLFILAASPDALTECSCCGKGVVEVKTSFKYRMCDLAGLVEAATTDASFCLTTDLQLKPEHKYYTQVQCQMGVTGRSNCHFLLYTTKAIVHRHIQFDSVIFDQLKAKAVDFFSQCIFSKLIPVD